MSSRRNFLYTSAIGYIIGSGIPGISMVKKDLEVSDRYPALDLNMINEVVGASHGNLDKVKELVGKRPELANATWDWGWGDIETALGAASHMGRRDIAEYLISKGARQDLFSMVMMGQVEVVKTIIQANTGIQRIPGPHGITVLQHAKNRLRRSDSMDAKEVVDMKAMISYLEDLGDADVKPARQSLTDKEKEIYVGEYRYGESDRDVLVVNLNMRKMMSVARKGDFGKAMYKVGDHTFGLESAPSVKVKFIKQDDHITTLNLMEPGFSLEAKRI